MLGKKYILERLKMPVQGGIRFLRPLLMICPIRVCLAVSVRRPLGPIGGEGPSDRNKYKVRIRKLHRGSCILK